MERSEVEAKYKWKAEDIFPSDEAWEEQYAAAASSLSLRAWEGKLHDAGELAAFFPPAGGSRPRVGAAVSVRAYAPRRGLPRRQIYGDAVARDVALRPLFVGNGVCGAGTDGAGRCRPAIVLQDERLRDQDYYLRCLIRSKKHVLSAAEEKLLAQGGEVYAQFQNIFSMIDNADIRFGEIEDGSGGGVPLTHGMYGVFLHGKDRDLRRRAFAQYYKSYIDLTNTIAATYFGNVKKDVFLSRARGYDSCLQRALEGEDVPVCVYENLISAVHENLPDMHRYIALRKRVLGYEEQHMYDIYAPLVEDAELKLSYEDACELVVRGLSPLGEEYGALLRKGFAEGWVDVCETAGKRSGAYSTGAYGVHPYVLLNYQQTTSDVFTIAHEMGHALHTYYSNAAQPYAKADYRIFVAEVASTVNEVLLLRHILSGTRDEKMQAYLLSYFLDTVRATLHRQTMFAEFESVAHGMVEKGTPLTSENMCAEYLRLNKLYYGDAIVHDEQIAYEWSRIPHFYTSFYVYKYATGIVSAISIAERILTEGAPAVADYKKFLSSGGSDSPVELLKIAGVDLTTQAPFTAAMRSFADTLDRLEKLLVK